MNTNVKEKETEENKKLVWRHIVKDKEEKGLQYKEMVFEGPSCTDLCYCCLLSAQSRLELMALQWNNS